MTVLDDVKVLLGNPENIDDKLSVIISITESRLKTLIAQTSIPDELSYIVTEVSLMRFNRVGSEGVSSHTVEGESLSFNDNDFDAFKDDINAWISANKSVSIRKVRFI